MGVPNGKSSEVHVRVGMHPQVPAWMQKVDGVEVHQKLSDDERHHARMHENLVLKGCALQHVPTSRAASAWAGDARAGA